MKFIIVAAMLVVASCFCFETFAENSIFSKDNLIIAKTKKEKPKKRRRVVDQEPKRSSKYDDDGFYKKKENLGLDQPAYKMGIKGALGVGTGFVSGIPLFANVDVQVPVMSNVMGIGSFTYNYTNWSSGLGNVLVSSLTDYKYSYTFQMFNFEGGARYLYTIPCCSQKLAAEGGLQLGISYQKYYWYWEIAGEKYEGEKAAGLKFIVTPLVLAFDYTFSRNMQIGVELKYMYLIGTVGTVSGKQFETAFLFFKFLL